MTLTQAVTILKNCNTCTRPVNDPYRVYSDNGEVIQGCVDACHTSHLQLDTSSHAWHNRPQAEQIRINMIPKH